MPEEFNENLSFIHDTVYDYCSLYKDNIGYFGDGENEY